MNKKIQLHFKYKEVCFVYLDHQHKWRGQNAAKNVIPEKFKFSTTLGIHAFFTKE